MARANSEKTLMLEKTEGKRKRGWQRMRWVASPTQWAHAVPVLVSSVMPDSLHPMHCSLPGSSVHEILQGRILEWVAMPSSKESCQLRG